MVNLIHLNYYRIALVYPLSIRDSNLSPWLTYWFT